MSKILITGASGFVGKHLTKQLASDHTLYAISRNPIYDIFELTYDWDTYQQTICDYDVIIHLAGLAHDTHENSQEQEYFQVNEQLTNNLVQWINQAEKPTKLIYLSSVKVYQEADTIDEKTPKNPNSIYGKSKLAAENVIINQLSNRHSYHILEPAMIYGEGNKGNLPKIYNALTRGLPYPFSSWQNQRSILYIDNLIFIINQCIEYSLDSDFYVISDDDSISTIEMLDELFETNKNAFIRWSLPHFMTRFIIQIASFSGVGILDKLLGSLVVDNRKIKNALKITALPIDVRKGLNITGQSFCNDE